MSGRPDGTRDVNLRVGLEIRIPDRGESGQQRYLWRLGAWLAERGHDVHYLTVLDHAPDVQTPPGTRLHRLGALSGRSLRAAVRSLDLDVLLLNPERSRRFRGLHANVLRPGYGTEHYRQKLRSFRTPLRSAARRLLRAMPWEALERRWERAFYEAPDPPPHVIAVSGYMRDEVLDSYRIPAEHVHVVHNGVDLDEFDPGRAAALRSEERDRFGIPPDALCLLFMGHNFRLKGLWPLMEAVRRIRAERADSDLHLLVAGRGTGERQRRRAHRFIADHDLGHAIHLAGPVRPAIRAFAAVDIFAHLSWHDAFGFVTLEAMAAGLPVITTPYTGATEIVEDGVSGLIIDPGDTGAITAAIRRLLDPELRERLAAAARDVGKRHSEESNFERVLTVFRQAAAPPRPVP
jgi:glycosyltransferase involved in cell wall biosynthesis